MRTDRDGNVYRKWTLEEDVYINKMWNIQTPNDIAKELQRTECAVRCRRSYLLGANKRRKRSYVSKQWTPEEIEYMKHNYGKVDTKELSAKLGRTIPAIQCKAHYLGLQQPNRYAKEREGAIAKTKFKEIFGLSFRMINSMIDKGIPTKMVTLQNGTFQFMRYPEALDWLKEHKDEFNAKNVIVDEVEKIGNADIEWLKEKARVDKEKHTNKYGMYEEIRQAYYSGLTYKELKEKFNVSNNVVYRAIVNNDKNRENNYSRWTEEELEYLRQNYKTKPISIMSKELNRSTSAIHGRINYLRKGGKL